MPKTTYYLLLLFIFAFALPTQASNSSTPTLPLSHPLQQKIVRWAMKRVEKRHQRLEHKLAHTNSPKKIAKIKQKQEITTFKVIIFFLGVLAGLVGLVGLAFKAEDFSTVCFVIMVCCFAILFPNLFR
jgi:hypothetical protein